MTRYKFEFKGRKNEAALFQSSMSELAGFNDFELYVDTKLLFWAQHFDGKQFATYPTGYQKGGTIRFAEGKIRMPTSSKLPVYEAEEYKAGKPPRGIVTISMFVVATLDELTEEELSKDGFTSAADAVNQMRNYYPTIRGWSTITYYVFGKYNSSPTKRELENLLENVEKRK